jgi:hypothetical protein
MMYKCHNASLNVVPLADVTEPTDDTEVVTSPRVGALTH